MERLHWIAAPTAGFDLYTDENNLAFMFDPLSFILDMAQITVRKVLPLAMG